VADRGGPSPLARPRWPARPRPWPWRAPPRDQRRAVLRCKRKKGKGSRRTVASPGGRRCTRFGRRRTAGGGIDGGGVRYLQGNGDGRRRFGAWRLDSSAREEEGGEGKLLGTSASSGEASSGGAGRQQWRWCSGPAREERAEGGRREHARERKR
jgi:hypothetical protein